jgi:hypothetical protein
MTPESQNIAQQLSLSESSNITRTYLLFAISLRASHGSATLDAPEGRPTATLPITTPLQE